MSIDIYSQAIKGPEILACWRGPGNDKGSSETDAGAERVGKPLIWIAYGSPLAHQSWREKLEDCDPNSLRTALN
ncbi:MAG: hypothetical protein KJO82_14130, partial [Gammaproteobacteria bacterium]|nr:hypothetical protein [Gammaproteobacteria bacterium]